MRRELKYLLVYFLVLGFVGIGCDKKTVNETPANIIEEVPAIELKEIAPLTIQQFEGSLKFTIQYTDANGDIGFEDADEKALEITDNRVQLVHTYHIPPITPRGWEFTTAGTLVVELDNLILIDQDKASETATFSLRLKDRAGNWSNTVTSEEVTITK